MRDAGVDNLNLYLLTFKTITPSHVPVLILTQLVKDVPEGVDKSRKEDYLCDVDFKTVLGMGREEWGKIAKWKKQQIKKKVGIF